MEEVRLTAREMMRRFDALNMQGPIARFDTKHFVSQPNPVLIAFIRMPGDNKPWGIAYGRANDSSARIACAIDPFDKDSYRAMIDEVGQYLDDEWGISDNSANPLPYPPKKNNDLPQVWVPDSSHLEMFNLLSYAAFTSHDHKEGDSPAARLGRIAGFLFEESNYKGQQIVLNARDVMNQMWVVPADDFSLGHIGYLYTWIQEQGSLDSRRIAALKASERSYSATLDTRDVEQVEGSPLVDLLLGEISNGASTRQLGEGEFSSIFAAQEVRGILSQELEARWDLLRQAWSLVTSDRRVENVALQGIMRDSISRFDSLIVLEREGAALQNKVASPPRTDTDPQVATVKYLELLKAEEKFLCQVVHDDRELLRDLFVEGTAFIGNVSRTWAEDIEGKTFQFWDVRLSPKFAGLFKRRESETYRVMGVEGSLEATLVKFRSELIDEAESVQKANIDPSDWILTLRWNRDNPLGTRANRRLSEPERLDLNKKISDTFFVGKDIIFVPAFSSTLFDRAIEAAKLAPRGKGKWVFDMPGVRLGAVSDEVLAPRGNIVDEAIAALAANEECAHVVRAAPGSGKSHNLLQIAKALVDKGHLVAIATQTNNQARDLCEKWVKEYKTDGESKLVRFVSTLINKPSNIGYEWISKRDELPTAEAVVISTAAKWGQNYQVSKDLDFYALLVDEAYQMPWSTFVQVSHLSSRFILIGDAGQIPPVVPVDARRWDVAPIPPQWPAPTVFSHNAEDGRVSLNALDTCWRLPFESIEFIKDFYLEQGLEVKPKALPGDRGLAFGSKPTGVFATAIESASGDARGVPIMLELPNDSDGPPLDRDSDVANQIAAFIEQLLKSRPTFIPHNENKPRPVYISDIAVCSTKRATNALIETAISVAVERLKTDSKLEIEKPHANPEDKYVRVDTPERMQGLEFPVFIAVHPMTNVTHPSEFDLETGRLCVMASRHQQALFIFTRSHLRQMMHTARIVSGHAPSGRDITGLGLRNHKRFLENIEKSGTWFSLAES